MVVIIYDGKGPAWKMRDRGKKEVFPRYTLIPFELPDCIIYSW